jgi:hypothetical protein
VIPTQAGFHPKAGKKASFFEKKNQKTFVWAIRQKAKVFASFFKKKRCLSCRQSASTRLGITVLLFAGIGAVPVAGLAATLEDLVRAYPDALAGAQGTILIWRDGTRMQADDRRPGKSFDAQLKDGSILDQLRLVYPLGAAIVPPRDDPGRVRNRAFFNKMYGDCQASDVAGKLVPVVWLPRSWGHRVVITSVNGVDRQLAAVSRELDALPDKDKKYLYPLGGTYACRHVAGGAQTSMHAWGAAIDINTTYSNYWRWQKSADGTLAYTNRIPVEIVSVFERHGFIWGGRWSHFDTMHFEYRPELLPLAKLVPR